MLSKKRIIKLLIFFFLVLNLAGLIVAGRNEDKSGGLGGIVLNIFSPVEELFLGTIKKTSGIWKEYFSLISIRRDHSKLKDQINRFKAQETLFKEVLLENQRLRTLLNFRKKIENKVIAAEVTGRDSSKWFNTIVVNRGKSSGVKVNYPVIVPQGIVGQVIEVSGGYSKVLLITDRMSGVDSLVQETRVRGIVAGTGENLCELKYLLRKFGVKAGDHIITSGMGGIFPKGLRVGSVVEVKKKSSGIFQSVKVQPFVDFEKLEEVLIIFKPPIDRDK